MYCRSCGNSFEDGKRFCPDCGAPADGATRNAERSAYVSAPKNKKSKTHILIMAIIALVFVFSSLILETVAKLNNGGSDISGILKINNIIHISVLTLPAGLFVLFCFLLEKSSPALTGIPMILYTAIGVYNLIVGLPYQQKDMVEYVVLVNVFFIMISFCYIVFYMFAVTGKFKSRETGKTLTAIFGGILIFKSFLVISGRLISYVEMYGASDVTLMFSFSVVLSEVAEIIMIIAMFACILFVMDSEIKTPNIYAGYALPQMLCPECGSRFPQGTKFCDRCGAGLMPVAQPGQWSAYNGSAPDGTGDAPSSGFAVLGFFIPIVGLILYLIWMDKLPLRAKSAGKGALIGFIVNVVLSAVSTVIYSIYVSNFFNLISNYINELM